MKYLIVLTCAVAAASAGLLPVGPLVVAGPQHLPVIGPNGVPIDEPAVQQARAAHLAHKVEAHARNGDLAVIAHATSLAYAHHGIASSLLTGHIAHPGLAAPIHHILRRGILAAAAPIVIAGPQHLPVIGPNGVPIDESAVQQARAAHLAHKVEAHARNGDLAVAALHGIHGLHGIHAVPVAHAIPAAYPTTFGLPAVTSDGIPLETPEVVAAKSNHFAAHSEALARNSPIISEAIIAHAAPLVHSW